MITNMPRGYIELSIAGVGGQTPDAIQLDFGDKLVWVPFSQIYEVWEEEGLVILKEWIAREKGLI